VKTTDTFLQAFSKMHKAVGDIVRNEATRGSVHHSRKVIDLLEKCHKDFTEKAQNSTETLVSEEQKYNTQKAADQQTVADHKQSLEENNNVLKTADAKMSEFQASATRLTANRMAKTTELKDEVELSGNRNTNFNTRYESRNDELQAITKAKAILLFSATEMDRSVSKGRADFKGLMQISKSDDDQDDDVEMTEADFPTDEAPEDKEPEAPTFLQMRNIPSAALEKLRKMAASQPHSEFALLVSGLSTKNPFAEVIGLIEQLIQKKNEQIARSASKAQMCDQEMTNIKENKAQAQKKFEEFSDEANTQAAKYDENKALHDQAKKDMAEADKVLLTHTTERMSNHATNKKQFHDAQVGYNATTNAIQTLGAYYNKKPELLQTEGNPLDEKNYGGAQGSASGIFGLLEVVASDFEKTYHQMQKDETNQAQEFMLLSRDHQKETTELRTLKQEYKRLRDNADSERQDAMASFQEQVTDWGKHLKAWQSIKKTCFDTGVPFEVREAKRQSEIDALKEALSTLEEYK